jgi:hypothetical protein
MERFIKYIFIILLSYAGIMLFYRGLHKLTEVYSKISAIKIEPYYPRHKDSIHYVVSFRVDNYADRLAIYVGDQNNLTNSKLIPLLDTIKTYTLLVDETEPSYDGMKVGVRKMIFEGNTLYKGSRLLNLVGGMIAMTMAFLLLLSIIVKSKKRHLT